MVSFTLSPKTSEKIKDKHQNYGIFGDVFDVMTYRLFLVSFQQNILGLVYRNKFKHDLYDQRILNNSNCSKQ